MTSRSWVVSLSLFALFVGGVSGQTLSLDSVYQLLLKVADAPSRVNYEGTVRTVFSGRFGARTVVVRIDHQATGRERLRIVEPAEDAGKVFIRNTREEARSGRHGPLSLGISGLKSRIRSDLSLLLSNYSLHAEGGGRVAGRQTFRIDITPDNPGRKSKEIWVDRKTGIVLKSVVQRPVGGVVVTTEFTEIRQTPESWTLPKSSEPPLKLPQQEAGGVSTGAKWIGAIDQKELATLKSLEEREHFVLLSPRYLPTGFVMEEVREFPSPTDSHSKVVHILYSDGLSSISLFLQEVEPFWPDRVRSFLFGHRRREGNNHHHPEDHGVAVVEGSQDGTRYVLVSDVATEILRRMAESLKPVEGVAPK